MDDTTFRVNPYGFTMATAEKLPLTFDVSGLLMGTQVPNSPTSVLLDDGTAPLSPITLTDSPTIAGNKIIQIVRGSELAASHSYLLRITFNADANTTWTIEQLIYCPR